MSRLVAESFGGTFDDGRRSATSSVFTNTIWSSVPSAPIEARVSLSNTPNLATNLTLPPSENSSTSSTLKLSVNPNMIESSVLSVSFVGNISTCDAENNVECTELDTLSFHSNISNSSISTSSQNSNQFLSPHTFTNLGRLMQLSANENESTGGHSVASSTDTLHHEPSELKNSVFCSGNTKEWWRQFQTDNDWECFRDMAAHYVSSLVAEELMEIERSEVARDRDPWRMKESTDTVTRFGHHKSDIYSLAKKILLRLSEAATAVITRQQPDLLGMNHTTETNMKYVSMLVKEFVLVQRAMKELPQIPPPFSDVVSLHDLPVDTRNTLVEQCSLLDKWRVQTIELRERLESKHSICHQKLLSAIIETEEVLFWSKGDTKTLLGSDNEDGYFEVIENHSSEWEHVSDAAVKYETRCLLKLRLLATFAAGTIGLVGVLLQSKRR